LKRIQELQKKKRKEEEDLKYKQHLERQKLQTAESILEETGVVAMATTDLKKPYFAWNIQNGDIVIKERIGEVETGIVFKAFHKQFQITAKKLKIKASTEAIIDKIREEIALIAPLAHDCLATVKGISVSDDVYIIQEFIQGISLNAYIRNKAISDDLDNKTVVKWGRQIIDGVAYLHANKVMHLALKSKNILLDRNMDVKLRDYGTPSLRDRIRTTNGFEYPEYLPPEVLAHLEFDESCDVYSFAIILIELFLHGNPYGAMTPQEIINGILTQGIRPEIPLETPSVFVRLIESSWQTEREKRPSAEKLLKILSQPEDKILLYNR